VSRCLYFSERYKPFDPDVSEKDRRLADEVSEDYDRRRQAEAEKRARELQQIVDKANYEVRNLLGAENWLALRRLMREERITFRNLLQPPEGLQADYDELNARRVAAGQRFLDGIGVASGDLRAIARPAIDAMKDRLMVPRTIGGVSVATHPDQWEELTGAPVSVPNPSAPDISAHHPSAHDLLQLQHQFQIFTPPFPGWQLGFGGWKTGEFQVGREVILDAEVGLVGHNVHLDNPDASIDMCCVIADTQVAFDFKAPVAGRVEVVIEAQSQLAMHDLTTEEEWGWSESSTLQQNFLMMHVIHPNVTAPSLAEMSQFDYKTDENRSVHRENLARGEIYFADLFSDGPVAQGDVVEIRAGTRSVDSALTDDVELHSRSQFLWLLRSVRVRIAP